MHQTIRMKDGREAHVRPVVQDDARGVWQCYRTILEERVGTVRGIEEGDKPLDHIENHTKELVELHQKHGGCLFAAVVAERIVGTGLIRRHPHARIKHVAHIGLGVIGQFQGLGLGRALMDAMIDWARALPNRPVSRLDLFVFAGNTRAIRLYESLGFATEGRRQRMIRHEDGREEDDLMMALFID